MQVNGGPAAVQTGFAVGISVDARQQHRMCDRAESSEANGGDMERARSRAPGAMR